MRPLRPRRRALAVAFCCSVLAAACVGLLPLAVEWAQPCSVYGCSPRATAVYLRLRGLTMPPRLHWDSWGVDAVDAGDAATALPPPTAREHAQVVAAGGTVPPDGRPIYPATVVTAFFDIEREAFDGRSVTAYLRWFRATLQLRCPMVVYTSPRFVPFVTSHRAAGGLLAVTRVVVLSPTELPLFRHRRAMEAILESGAYRRRIADGRRIECRLPLYNILQYSKFSLVRRAAAANPFRSAAFFWLDAGAGRWVAPVTAAGRPWPDPAKLADPALGLSSGSLIIQSILHERDRPTARCGTPPESEYVWGHRSLLAGTFFGGTAAAVARVEAQLDALLTEMLASRVVNNEQVALWVLACRTPDVFRVLPRVYDKHAEHLRPWWIFKVRPHGYIDKATSTPWATCTWATPTPNI